MIHLQNNQTTYHSDIQRVMATEIRKATSLTQVYPVTGGDDKTIYKVSYYETGKLALLDPHGLEEVETIEIVYADGLYAKISFKDYGVVEIHNHIEEIRYENDYYVEIRRLRDSLKEAEDDEARKEIQDLIEKARAKNNSQ